MSSYSYFLHMNRAGIWRPDRAVLITCWDWDWNWDSGLSINLNTLYFINKLNEQHFFYTCQKFDWLIAIDQYFYNFFPPIWLQT